MRKVTLDRANPSHLYTLRECCKLLHRNYEYILKLYKLDLLPNPMNTKESTGPGGHPYKKRLFTYQEVCNLRDKLQSPFFTANLANRRGQQEQHGKATGRTYKRSKQQH